MVYMSGDLPVASVGEKAQSFERVIIRTVGLKKQFVKKEVVTHALRGIDVEIFQGEFIAIMGPSGSGKTTFFNAIGGLDTPTEGRIFIDEVDVAQLSAVELAFLRCRKIGYIFQQFNLVQYMTALENVTTPMTFAGTDADEARKRGMDLLRLVGLEDRWAHRPIEMSGGQQQRVAIARSMSNNPSILLCDEPTGNLDLHTGQDILDILKRVNDERGVTVICATHDYRLYDICHRLMWIKDGRVDRLARRDEIDVKIATIDGE